MSQNRGTSMRRPVLGLVPPGSFRSVIGTPFLPRRYLRVRAPTVVRQAMRAICEGAHGCCWPHRSVPVCQAAPAGRVAGRAQSRKSGWTQAERPSESSMRART